MGLRGESTRKGPSHGTGRQYTELIRSWSRSRVAVLVGTAVLGLAVVTLRLLHPLGEAWNPDEWYMLGANLAVHGTLGIGDSPTVFRPPGYPAFIALVLEAVTGGARAVTPALVWGTRPAVALAQALALALAAAGAFLWWRTRLGPAIAAAAALALVANPYTLALVGLPHYALVHLALLVLGTWALAEGLRRGAVALAAAGILWGAITLLRPITLPLPAVVLVLLWAQGRRGRALARGGLGFALGFTLAVVPWTIRNYDVRGRFIPVNAQAWTVLWAASLKPLPIHPNHFNWYAVAPEYEAVFRRVTGEPGYSYAALYSHDVALEDAFRAEALRNLESRPGVYLGNVARATGALLFGTSRLPITLLVALQRPGAHLEDAWFAPGNPQDFDFSWAATAFVWLQTALVPLAAFGLFVGARGRDPFLLAPAGVAFCVLAAHALTYMDLFYYYVRAPFLFLLAFYGLARLRERARGGARGPWPTLAALGLGAAFVLSSLVMLGEGLARRAG